MAAKGTAEAGSYPLAAQIPLQSFTLPDFPPEQSSHLRELTLTSDIKLSDYQSLVQTQADAIITQAELPSLPGSITHLTLELFGLGFPGTPPFLTRLARSLPNLRSITVFSCLIDGLDVASRKDAERFFEVAVQGGLREIHFIDSFARPGFFQRVDEILTAKAGNDGVKVVEVSYTFRGHEDSDFLARVQGEELIGLLGKGVVGASFDFVPERKDDLAEQGEKEDGKESGKINEGVLPFASDGRASAAVRKRFEDGSAGGEFRELKVLNLGMWTLRPGEVAEVVYACAGGGEGQLADLTVGLLLEEDWVEKLADGLGKGSGAAALEGIEIIGVPDRAEVDGDDWKSGLSVVKKAEVERLAKACPRLGKFGMSILKVKSAPNVVFMKEDGAWVER